MPLVEAYVHTTVALQSTVLSGFRLTVDVLESSPGMLGISLTLIESIHVTVTPGMALPLSLSMATALLKSDKSL